MVQGFADVRVIGDGPRHRHAAGWPGGDPPRHELAGINQQPRGNAFLQAVALERPGAVGDLHQPAAGVLVKTAFPPVYVHIAARTEGKITTQSAAKLLEHFRKFSFSDYFSILLRNDAWFITL